MKSNKPGKSWQTAALIVSLTGVLFSNGCGSLPVSLAFGPSPAPSAALRSPETQAPASAETEPPPALTATPTAGEFALNLTPLPTETALPTLALPTESKFAGALEAWDGMPTYLADSQPGFAFRVSYDPSLWANTVDAYGSPALANRTIPGCMIAPTAGRGLPLNGTVDHAVRRIGAISFQVNTAYVNGVRQFVNYVGGDGVVSTGFQVSFAEPADQCLSQAESVLGTLKAVALSEATPVPQP